jgi:2-octaprenylphenol hydroxylase
MKKEFDVLVAGGGMVGLAATALLARVDGLRVTMVDAGSQPIFDPTDDISLRVSSLAPGSIGMLSSIGAWEEILATRACPFRDMKVWDAFGSVDGPETLVFDSAEFAVPQLGFIVENNLVQHAILETLDRNAVTVRYDTAIQSIARAGSRIEVRLESGEKLLPESLIGADGARSVVRSSAGIAVRSWPHAQKAFVTVLQPEYSHANTAWQRFLKHGPIGMLPLSDGRISIVWSTTPDQADDAMAMNDDALGALLTEITDGVLGQLTPAGPRGTFPLRSQHAVDYVQDGLVLIGDAAHTIHPLAGQGVNLGFADAVELADIFATALAAGEYPGDIATLRRYERARKGANQTMLRFMDVLNRLFSNESRALARLRGAGMFLFNRSGLIRERVVQTALGIR